MNRRSSPLLAALLLAAALTAPGASAQEFPPSKPMTIVIGFAAGGALDATARIVAQRLTQTLGRSVVVSNRPGAGGNIAQQMVQQGDADGSTLLLATVGSLAINPHLIKFPYDPLTDLAPVTLAVTLPNVLVVRTGLGVKTLAEFVALAKKQPDQISYASGGVGTAGHMAGEMFNYRAGLNILHVPYKGGAPAITDLLGGQVSSYYASPRSAIPYVESKQLVALATTGLERDPYMPNVPTMAESGFPGFNAVNWYAFVVTGKTPQSIVRQWNRHLVEVLSAPDVRTAFAQHGLEPKPGTPEQAAAFIEAEFKAWGSVIKERRVTLK